MSKRKKYVHRKGTRVGGDPHVIGEELEAIRAKYGKLCPEDVVKSSRPKSAPLHDLFEWNDTKAAEGYRLSQARTIIRSVQFVPYRGKEPVTQYVHVRMNPVNESYYQDISVAVQNPDEYESAMAEAMGKLFSAQRAVEELRECAKRHKRKDVKGIGAALNGIVSATKKLQDIQESATT